MKLDRTSHELLVEGRRLRLGEKPFRVLEALVEAKGDVVTRTALRKLLWPDDTFVDFDNNLNSAVASLRKALGDSAREPRFIETLPKVGYRILVPAASPRRKWRWPVGIAAAGTLLVGMLLVTVGRRSESGAPPPPGVLSHLERGRFLRARFFERQEAPLLEEALEEFREARREGPLFAPAAAEEADTLVEMSFAGVTSFREGLERAREAANATLALAPSNATGLRVAGTTALFLDWDFQRAGEWLERAARAAPDDAQTSLAEATYLAALGRHDAAIRAAERAVSLDPETYYVRANLALFYLAGGRDEDAAASARRVLEVAPGFRPALRYAILANERLGRWDEAARAVVVLVSLAPEDGFTAADADPRAVVEEWRRWELAQIETLAAGRRDELALELALRHANLGEHDAALEYLERAYRARNAMLVFLEAFPELHTLRGDPRFARLSENVRRGDS